MTREEILKEKIISKKDAIKRSFRNKLSYDKWDRKSPIYAYSILTSDIEIIGDIQLIKFLLSTFNFAPYVVYFSDKKDAEMYKWVHNIIEKTIDDSIAEGFSDYTNNFVDHINIDSEDCDVLSINY